MVFVPFFLALALSLVLVPLVRRLSLRLGYVVKPREDRWHNKPTATLGGIGIFLALFISLFLSAPGLGGWGHVRWEVLAGSVVVFLLGLYDDLKELSPQSKLSGQILAAGLAVALGFTTNFFTPRISNSLLAQLPNILLTFVWLVGITNAINLLDNMDGLSGGISLITAGILSFFFWKVGNISLLAISLALAGSVLGFLIFNFPPASIFMGDSGSLFMGFTLAVLAIARQPQASNVFAVMGVPTLLFLLPIMDTVLVTFTRILRGQSPTKGGRDHTSHRLIAFGLTERQAVLVLYGVALLSGIMAATLESLKYWLSLAVMPILVVSLAILTAYLGGLKVVSATSNQGERAITRIMLDLTFRRRILEVSLDFFIIGIAYYLAFLTRSGFILDAVRMEVYLQSVPLILVSTYLVFFVLGVYRGVWRYVGMDDLLRYGAAVVGSLILSAAAVVIIYPAHGITLDIFLLYGIFLFLGMAASRSSFRVLDLVGRMRIKAPQERVLIYSAGDEGEMALRWIQMNPQLAFQPVGFLDDDPFMAGREIHGIAVLGDLNHLEEITQRRKIDGLIVTSSKLSDGALREAVKDCRERGLWVRSLRLEFELLD
ncbi:MAG: hypothetical protein ACM3H7_06195 [Acidobacteriaceae bacterium]